MVTEPVKEAVLRYARETLGTQAEYLFASSPDCAVLRCRANRKWYGIIMRVGRDKLVRGGEGDVDILNVKCDPMMRASLLKKAGFFPAYHMNKTHWITLDLAAAGDEKIKVLVDVSYNLVAPKRRRSPAAGGDL